MNVISTLELSKHYKGRSALSRVTLQIPMGQMAACVGAPGSGKTTLLHLLAGLYRPSGGDCSVLGCSPFFEADKLHGMCGAVLQSAQLYKTMTVSENLHFFASLNEVDQNDAIDRLSFLLHRLDIWESRETPTAELTTGVAQRASLARALMHRPKILLMDAPPFGYNRETGDAISDLLRYLQREENLTVLFSAEDMDYASDFCENFFLLHQGELIARGDPESLRVGAGVNCRAVLRLGEGETLPEGFTAGRDGWQKEIKDEHELPRLISQLVQEGKHIYEARVITPGLSEIYEACLVGGIHRVGESHDTTEQPETTDRTGGTPEE